MIVNKKVVLLASALLLLVVLSIVLQPFSVAGNAPTQITPTATMHVTTTPKPPPGPSRTPTATPVDADFLPVIIRPYVSPTISPTPTTPCRLGPPEPLTRQYSITSD